MMEEEADSQRCWEELVPDLLGRIFKNLTLQELLNVIPAVCKLWRKAVMGPYCWQEIDIQIWSNESDSKKVDRMVRMLIERSCGSVRKLCVSGLQNETCFSFIAEHAGPLQTLKLPRSDLNGSITENIAAKLSNLTCLDLSYCDKIGNALIAIGRNCRSLTKLSRNMYPVYVEEKLPQNDEALAIATTMPKLKHLEMAYHLIDTTGFSEIISGCTELEFFDLRGCWDVKVDENYMKVKFPKLNLQGPHVVDEYECTAWEDGSDYSDSDSFYDYEGMSDDDLEFVQVRYYEGFDEASFYLEFSARL